MAIEIVSFPINTWWFSIVYSGFSIEIVEFPIENGDFP